MVYWDLPVDDRVAMRQAFIARRRGEACACGGAKRANVWFCEACVDQLLRAGFGRDLLQRVSDRLADAVMRAQHWDGKAGD